MEAVLELQKALIKNYYLGFISSFDDALPEITLYSELIIHRNREYIEKDIETIRNERKYIIEDIKILYNAAISEVFLKLSKMINNDEKTNYLINIIQLIQTSHKQLKDDFYINDKKSRYYSTVNVDNSIDDINPFKNYALNLFDKKTDSETKKVEYTFVDLLDLYDINLRHEVLSFLPYSLFIISNGFINFLNKQLDEINAEIERKKPKEKEVKIIAEESKKPNQLTSNQIIILLDQLQILVNSNIKDFPKTKQAEILSLITGLNSQNLRKNIGKLEKKPSELNDRYRKDFDKVKEELEKFK